MIASEVEYVTYLPLNVGYLLLHCDFVFALFDEVGFALHGAPLYLLPSLLVIHFEISSVMFA